MTPRSLRPAPGRRRRSCLTVPGDDERKLARAAAIEADEVIIDFEDAVAATSKDLARERTVRALRDLDWRAPTVAVRVNGPRTAWQAEDLAALRELTPAVIVVPKVESPDDVADMPAPTEALIETAAGLASCEEIARAGGLECLVLGPADLAASLGVPELTIGVGAHLDYALARLLVAARAHGLAAIDGPYAVLDDSAGLRASARRSRALGYDGKWCIHPSQVETCNEIYSPTDDEIARARRLLSVDGVARLEGEMVDEASRRLAESVLARAGTIERGPASA